MLSQVLEIFKNKKIALYGLSAETQRILPEVEMVCEVVGLLDGFKTNGELFEKPIISLEEAIMQGIEGIIVVARPGSARAIAKRIGAMCKRTHIALFDMRGKDLLITDAVTYDFSKLEAITKDSLIESIKAHDVISFDLFDTLLMRQVLEPTDVLSCVEQKAFEEQISVTNLARKRLASEKELSRDKAPFLCDIYRDAVKCDKVLEDVVDRLEQLEWETDYALCLPRREVCDVFKTAYEMGKKVYVVSDSYYRKEQIIKLLEKCGITEYTDVLVSCEYGFGKTLGLHRVLREKEADKSILHIGDDIVADVEYAKKEGIDTYRIYSGRSLLEATGMLGLEEEMVSYSDRLKAGMLVARLFNSPFQFEREDRKLCIEKASDMGYLLFAPILSDFAIWFYENVEKEQLENIWFGARDGYLMQNLYELLPKKKESVYFLTSRMAAMRAGIKSEQDIAYVQDMQYFGTVEAQLKERFGIEVSDTRASLIEYKDAIFEKAALARQHYQAYIDSVGLQKGRVAFFDFVAKGTTQMYLTRLVEQQIKGLYFLQLEPEYMKDKNLDIISFYSKAEATTSAIYENYYVLETILTAPHASVNEFDNLGHPVYATETRSKEAIACVMQMQEGILEFFKTYLACGGRIVNKALDEKILLLMHKIRLENKDFSQLVIEDPFFNRMTPVTDMILTEEN